MKRAEIGALGEAYVCEKLVADGYVIIEKNYHSRYGEIDIIAQNNSYVIFVEVKTRAKGSMVSGLEAVTPAKMKKIYKTALMWLMNNPVKLQPRLDVCEVVTERANSFEPIDIIYIKNAFGSEVYE